MTELNINETTRKVGTSFQKKNIKIGSQSSEVTHKKNTCRIENLLILWSRLIIVFLLFFYFIGHIPLNAVGYKATNDDERQKINMLQYR